MSVTEIKKHLHQAIEAIEDQQFLEAMLTIAVSNSNVSMHELSDEQINILREREVRLNNGEAKLVPWEKVNADIKKKYGF